MMQRERDVFGPRRMRAIDGQRCVRADDLERLTLGRIERALERRGETIAEVEPARERGIDTGLRE